MNAPLSSYGVLDRSLIKGLLFLDLRYGNFAEGAYRSISAKHQLSDIMSSIFNASPGLIGLRLSIPNKAHDRSTIALPNKLPSLLKYLELAGISGCPSIDLRAIRSWTELRALSLVDVTSISPDKGPLTTAAGTVALFVASDDLVFSSDSEGERVPLPPVQTNFNPPLTPRVHIGGTTTPSTFFVLSTLLENKV